MIKLAEYNFNLPKELIAKHPAIDRDDSKLMIVNRKTGEITHGKFTDVLDYFNTSDVMVMNNTKVFPARLYGIKEKTGAEIEVFLLRELNSETYLWDVLVDPARKIRSGNKLYFGENQELVAEVIDNTTSRGRTIRFLFAGDHDELKSILKRLGETPLPVKIIDRKVVAQDKERYQTIYAKHEGAVAAPTAGMHLSKTLMKRLEIKGVEFAEVTLHVGLGNFTAVVVEDLSKHKMESEQFFIEDKAVNTINTAKVNGNNIIAIGTTSMRATESSVSIVGMVKPFSGWTNKFIFPPYDFKVANMLVTNFHLPQSTQMMMAAAFTGFDLLMKAYQIAIEKKYKFFTYGDAMLII